MKKTLSSEQRKKQILSAARTLFAKKGYDAATLDEIASKVGVSRPRILQLFGSKQNIYESIAKKAYREHPMDEDLARHIRRNDDVAVFEAFAFHILSHTERREEREILKILLYARLKEDRFHRTHFHEKDLLMIGRLEEYVTKRVDDGAFKDMNPLVVIYAYQAMISNLAIYKNVMKKMDFVTSRDLCRDCANIFVEGLCSTADGHGSPAAEI